MPDFIFDREEERQRIDQFLAKRRSFLIYGPSGVGKTLLLRNVLPRFRSVLYCEDSATTNVMFRSLARSLLRLQSPRATKAFRDEDAITAKSAVSLKGIVMDALREGEYSIVLDHLKRPSYSFAVGRSRSHRMGLDSGERGGALQPYGRHGFSPADLRRPFAEV